MAQALLGFNLLEELLGLRLLDKEELPLLRVKSLSQLVERLLDLQPGSVFVVHDILFALLQTLHALVALLEFAADLNAHVFDLLQEMRVALLQRLDFVALMRAVNDALGANRRALARETVVGNELFRMSFTVLRVPLGRLLRLDLPT